MTTKNSILSAVRREPFTVTELVKQLDVTRNAVILPVKQLEADGLIRGRERRGKTAGKPPIEYYAVPGTEDSESQAYRPFLVSLLDTLPSYLDRGTIDSLMNEIGTHMAREANVDSAGSFEDRLAQALGFLDDLGAGTESVSSGTDVTVRSFSCPLGRITRDEPCVCAAMAQFFNETTGGKTTEECQRADQLVCQFRIAPK